MDTICFLQVPDNFEELYDGYRKRLSGVKPQEVVAEQLKVEPHTSGAAKNGSPSTQTDNGIGYFKFYKEGAKIKIGGKTRRPFLLLQSLCDPFGAEKTVEQVFETIKIPSDADDQGLKEWAQDRHGRMVQIIKNSAIKELQKIKELQGKLSYEFSRGETTLRLRLEE